MKSKIKIILLCFTIFFLYSGFNIPAQTTIESKIYEAEQGQTLIINLQKLINIHAEQLKFKIFDRYYYPIEKNGLYLIIGIDFEKEPGKYKLSIFNNENLIGKATVLIKKIDYPEISLNDNRTTFSGKLQKQRQKENENIYKAFCGNNEKIQENIAGNFINPLDKTEQTSPIRGAFGTIRKWRNKVITRHRGVDLRAPFVPIKAIADGKVIMARNYLLEGKFIIIKHPGDIYSMYVHLSKISVKEGAVVKIGQKIGISGATGNAQGAHLHFIIKINCATVDPLEFLKITNQF